MKKLKISTKENPIHAFVLPNGKNLSYAWPQNAHGGQFKWNQSYLTQRLLDFKAKKKERQVRVGLWTSRSNMHLVCADFDNLPKGFEDWECFFEFAKATWPEGFIYRSYNQKVKIIFVGELDEDIQMCAGFGINLLRSRIGYEFFDYLDLGTIAISTCFINGYQVPRLREWLCKAKVFSIETIIESHEYHSFDEILPTEVIEFIENGGESQMSAREIFIRKLLKMSHLNGEGFDLPITKIGRECEISHARVSEWRHELVSMGWLRLTDDHYCKGYKGKTYKADGLLRKLIYKTAKLIAKTLKINYSKLPEMLKEGYWEQSLWTYSKYFIGNPKAFIDWGLSLEGIRQKRRWKKLYRSINSRLKYARLPKLSIPKRI